ncbi:MAG TPA: M56 family metallopeptidase [Longimicrobium sp.]|nr:M56 family metallopeptidase [Longimicrobium sp.]
MDVSLPSSAAAPWLASAVWLVARGTLLLAAAALAALALRRGSAASRHLVWGLALAAMLALPAASLLMPRWEMPFVHLPAAAPSAGAAGDAASAGGGLPWSTIVLLAWAAGALATLGRYLLSMATVRVVARRSRPVRGGEWMERMDGAARELGMRERVRLLRADGAVMPMTWGILHPAVLVPADADGWAPERKRVVLLHELAHVARRDCLWQTLASLCCAAYWFHPGVWWAARQMRIEREQACDDRVLRAGTRASEYAGHLLEVARSFRARPLTAAAAMAMARRSQLEGRVLAVLDAARDRAAVPGRAALVAGGIAAAALFPVAAAAPGRAEAPAPAPVQTAFAAAPERRTADAEPEAREAPAPAPQDARGVQPAAAAHEHHAARETRTAPAEESYPDFGVIEESMLATLIRATHDVDPDVRRSAVQALGQMNGRAVVNPLLHSATDVDPRVRNAAVLALSEYRQRQSAARIALAKQPPCEGLQCPASTRPRVPTGSAVPGSRPRNARTDINAGPADLGLSILNGVAEEDTMTQSALTPIAPGPEM